MSQLIDVSRYQIHVLVCTYYVSICISIRTKYKNNTISEYNKYSWLKHVIIWMSAAQQIPFKCVIELWKTSSNITAICKGFLMSMNTKLLQSFHMYMLLYLSSLCFLFSSTSALRELSKWTTTSYLDFPYLLLPKFTKLLLNAKSFWTIKLKMKLFMRNQMMNLCIPWMNNQISPTFQCWLRRPLNQGSLQQRNWEFRVIGQHWIYPHPLTSVSKFIWAWMIEPDPFHPPICHVTVFFHEIVFF